MSALIAMLERERQEGMDGAIESECHSFKIDSLKHVLHLEIPSILV